MTRPIAGLFGPRSRLVLVVAVTAVACLVWSTPAAAGTIGRAELDGSGVERSLIRTPSPDPPGVGTRYPSWVAVERAHLYWTEFAAGGFFPPPDTIQRATLDGSRVRTLIQGFVRALAVDARHIYWVAPGNNISRARLDGSAVKRALVAGIPNPWDIAVAGDHIYWISGGGADDPLSGVIGRARLDGSKVEPALITGVGLPWSLAVDDRYVYWTNNTRYPTFPTPDLYLPGFDPVSGGVLPPRAPFNAQVIGRARLDGSGVDRRFIPIGLHGASYGIAVDRGHLYWTDMWSGLIGRARKDGSHVEKAFIRAPYGVIDVAVEGGRLYWTSAFTPASTVTVGILSTELTLRRVRICTPAEREGDPPRCGPARLYPMHVQLACRTAPNWPCTGNLRIVTANPVRYRGKKRRVTLARLDYTIPRATLTRALPLGKRKLALVRANPRARVVRVIAQAVDANGLMTATKRMTISLLNENVIPVEPPPGG